MLSWEIDNFLKNGERKREQSKGRVPKTRDEMASPNALVEALGLGHHLSLAMPETARVSLRVKASVVSQGELETPPRILGALGILSLPLYLNKWALLSYSR